MEMTQQRKFLSRLLLRAVSVLVVVAIVLSVLPVQTAQARACKFRHRVKPGETLIYIAELYQYDWQLIAEANDLKEPYILTVGQVLCIPGGTRPSSTAPAATTSTGTTTSNAPTMTAGSAPNSVYVKLEHFPKFLVVYVRIYPTNGEGVTNPNPPEPPPGVTEYRIGRLRTDKNGFAEDWIHIPGYVPENRIMTVCVKNVWTDEFMCIQYEHIWWNLYQMLALRGKEGR